MAQTQEKPSVVDPAKNTLSLFEYDDLLRQAVPPLAKKFFIDRRRAWQILGEYEKSVQRHLAKRRSDQAFNGEMKAWWGRFKDRFCILGMSCLSKYPCCTKLPDHLYNQVVCLLILTKAFEMERARNVKLNDPHVSHRKTPVLSAQISEVIDPSVCCKLADLKHKTSPLLIRVINRIIKFLNGCKAKLGDT